MKGQTHQQVRDFWKSQDWTKSNEELVKSTGYSLDNVKFWRERQNIFIYSIKDFWEKVDWTKSNGELVQLLHKNKSTISYWRRRLNKPKVYENSKLKYRTDWDWTKRDTDLAKWSGLSKERVRQIRKKLNKPKYNPDDRYEPIFKKMIEDLDKQPLYRYLSCRLLSRIYGLPYGKVLVLKSLGILHGGGNEKFVFYKVMNFSIPPTKLAKIWFAEEPFGIQKICSWKTYNCMFNYDWKALTNEEKQDLLEKEEQKAREVKEFLASLPIKGKVCQIH